MRAPVAWCGGAPAWLCTPGQGFAHGPDRCRRTHAGVLHWAASNTLRGRTAMHRSAFTYRALGARAPSAQSASFAAHPNSVTSVGNCDAAVPRQLRHRVLGLLESPRAVRRGRGAVRGRRSDVPHSPTSALTWRGAHRHLMHNRCARWTAKLQRDHAPRCDGASRRQAASTVQIDAGFASKRALAMPSQRGCSSSRPVTKRS